ncbi:DUF5522 domain-containing protein [Pedobacter sp. BS3]|uniref:DUF5522 domain-containing protein n=1 Tax=Pedobacter sp. BS3 TaxID=2567937 RepID=UPI0016594B4E|nr:DUF5522 domain-containing protein [Pedobacter sp. BS3]
MLIEGDDYYVDKNGNFVFTSAYHLKRGYCCKNNCRHCPWKVKEDKKRCNKNK